MRLVAILTLVACGSAPPPAVVAPAQTPGEPAPSCEETAIHIPQQFLSIAAPDIQRCAAEHMRQGMVIVGTLALRAHLTPEGHLRELDVETEPADRSTRMYDCFAPSMANWQFEPPGICASATLDIDFSSEISASGPSPSGTVEVVHTNQTNRAVVLRRGTGPRFHVTTSGNLDELAARRVATLPLGETLDSCLAASVHDALRGQTLLDLDTPLRLTVRFQPGSAPALTVRSAPSPAIARCVATTSWPPLPNPDAIAIASYELDIKQALLPEIVQALRTLE